MTQRVTFIVDAKHAQAIQAFLDVSQAVDRAGGKGAEAGDKHKRAGEDSGRAWGGALKVLESYPAAFVRMVSGTAAVYAGIRQVANEFERLKTVRQEAYEQLVGQMGDYREATWNIPPEWQRDPRFQQMAGEGIQTYARPAGEYFKMLGYGFSSAGALLPSEEIHKAANALAGITGHAQLPAEDTGQMLGALTRIMAIQREKGKPMDAKEMLGSLFSTFESSPSPEARQYMLYGLRSVLYQMEFQNVPFKRAAAYQATLAGMINDIRERRGGTGLIQGWEKMEEAYAQVRAKGFTPPGVETLADWRDLRDETKLSLIRDKSTDFGLAMQGWLKGMRSDDQAVQDMAHLFGEGHMGASFGEAGIQAVIEDLLEPQSNTAQRVEKIAATIKEGGEARKLYETLERPPITTEQEALFQEEKERRGALEAVRWQSVQLAREGAFLKLVEETGKLVDPRTALGQKFADIKAAIAVPGLPREKLSQMEQDLAREMIETTLNQRKIWDDREGFRQWIEARGGRSPVPQAYPMLPSGGLGFRELEDQVDPKLMREWRRETITGPNRTIVETFERFLRARQELDRRTQQELPNGGSYAPAPPPVGRLVPATAEPTTKPRSSERRPPAESVPGLPPAADQSFHRAFDRVLDRLDYAASTMAAAADRLAAAGERSTYGHLDIEVEDRSGRPVSRATSRPSGIDQFYDDPIG